MAAYRRVYDSRHLQADCQEPGSAPEPYARRTLRFLVASALDLHFTSCHICPSTGLAIHRASHPHTHRASPPAHPQGQPSTPTGLDHPHTHRASTSTFTNRLPSRPLDTQFQNGESQTLELIRKFRTPY